MANWPLIGVNRRAAPLAGECNAHFMERYGVEYRPEIECPNLSTCCFNVEMHDDAVVVLPRHRRDLLGENSVLLDIEEEDCRCNAELVWDPKNRNPCIAIFLDEFRKFAEQQAWSVESPHRKPTFGQPVRQIAPLAGPTGA